jgi:hypothetical protein
MVCKEWMLYFICGNHRFIVFSPNIMIPQRQLTTPALCPCIDNQSSLFGALVSELPISLFLLSAVVDSGFLVSAVDVDFFE